MSRPASGRSPDPRSPDPQSPESRSAGPQSPESRSAGPEVVTLGETMALLCAPRTGPLRHATSLDLSTGGCESNLAIGLARLGHRVAWIGRVGADEFGALVRRTLAAEGVDARITVDGDAPTGLMVKARRTATVTRVSYYRSGSAGSRLCPADVDADLIAAARVLHVSGITPALSASAGEAVRQAIGVARQAGVRVSLDLNYRRALWSPQRAGVELAELVGLSDLVFAGEDEATLVLAPESGADPTATAVALGRGLARLGPAEVLIKRGPRGALAVVGGQVIHAAPYPVAAVDPVGAGDAFAAGYLSALLDGAAPAERLDRASRMGAFAVTVPGDWEGLPGRDELDLLLVHDGVHR